MTAPRVAPPDKASALLRSQGFPVSAKALRRWHAEGKIPGCWSGKRLLLNIGGAVSFLERGDEPALETERRGVIRRVNERGF